MKRKADSLAAEEAPNKKKPTKKWIMNAFAMFTSGHLAPGTWRQSLNDWALNSNSQITNNKSKDNGGTQKIALATTQI